MPDSQQKLRVLICEDEAVSLLLLRSILEKRGYEVIGEATTGLQAINLYDEKKPDLVLLDINMPKGGGITTLRFMRELDPIPYIVILTGDNSKFNVETTKKLGANDYVLKSTVAKPNFLDRLQVWSDTGESRAFEEVIQEQQQEEKTAEKTEESEAPQEEPKKVNRMARAAMNTRQRRQ